MVDHSFVARLRTAWRLSKRADVEREFILSALRDQIFVEEDLAHWIAQFGSLDSASRMMLVEALRLKEYTAATQAERYWLEIALEQKHFVMSALNRKRGEENATARFLKDFEDFDALAKVAGNRLSVRREDLSPQLNDATETTTFDRHYLYHPAWAARILAKTRPIEHVDIGSILHFSTILSAFIPTRFYDYRPAVVELSGLTTGHVDLLSLPFANGSMSSLSCMHVLEHIGLGRYGEPLDPDGDLKAIAELVRVLAPGGDLLIATPVGRPCVRFNAHRVYAHEAFAAAFAALELMEFALIPEHGEEGLVVSPPVERVRQEVYGCGCFWFRKPSQNSDRQKSVT